MQPLSNGLNGHTNDAGAVLAVDMSQPEPDKYRLGLPGEVRGHKDMGPEGEFTTRTDQIEAIGVPVPPGVEETLGYHGVGRFVSFHMDRCGVVRTWDGDDTGLGIPSAFDLYTRHILTRPWFEGFDLNGQKGDGDSIIIDRLRRRVHVGPFSQVSHFIAERRYQVDDDEYTRRQGAQALAELKLSEWLSRRYEQSKDEQDNG